MANRGRNEGSIFKKANGKWRAQVSIKGKRLSLTANTRAECNDWLRKMLDQIDRGMTFEGRNLTLAEYLKSWITVKKNALRLNTGLQYEQLIKLNVEPSFGKMKLKDLNVHVVNRFYQGLVERGVGISSIGYTHRILHSALEEAERNGILGRNPAHGATVPRLKHKEMKILNEQQVGLFLVVASNSRYKNLYHLAVTTGMRISELRGLSWSDIDWIKGTVTVRRQIQDIQGNGAVSGRPKTFAGIRTILLGETTLNKLREQKSIIENESKACDSWQTNDLVFPSSVGTPFEQSHVHKDFIKVLEAANLQRIRFHDLRHTAASLMLNHGVPALVVSKILGHSNPSVTLIIYAHSTLDMQTKAASVMDEIITPIPVNISQLHPSAPDLHPIAPDQKR
ncbi:MAG: site-specific integrase [Chloroflexi bacterium]|nr:site-specific integrase [Chloroflexota bacterium]